MSNPSVLMLNYFDESGGAAKMVNRLYSSLIKGGSDISLLTSESYRFDGMKVELPPLRRNKSFLFEKLDKIPNKLHGKKKGALWSNSILGSAKVDEKRFDLLHLHWVTNGMLSIEQIKKLKSPLVWTFHDLWPFTGGCHYPQSCEQLNYTCENCPLLKSSSHWAKKQLLKKIELFKNKQIHAAVPSNWMKTKIEQSAVKDLFSVDVISNGIDLNVFRPQDSEKIRSELGIEHSKKVICFGAFSPFSNLIKGGDLLKGALNEFFKNHDRSHFELIILGANGSEDLIKGVKTHWMGVINSETRMAELYSCADISCIPSRYESFGQMALESIACGTPAIVFDGSGLSDIVKDKVNGAVVRPFDISAYAQSMNTVLENLDSMDCKNGLEQFDIDVCSQKYQSLYERILK